MLKKLLLSAAIALTPVAALAQQALPPLQNGTPGSPSVTGVDTFSGLYFAPGNKGAGFTGHLESSPRSVAPSLTSCGSGVLSPGSSDVAGTITLTGVTACTLNFGVAWASVPSCVLFDQTTNRATLVGIATTTQIPISGATAADVISYLCVGRSAGS